MTFSAIKTPKDVLEFIRTNIKYGWLDYMDKEHVGDMIGFRACYRTSSLEEVLEHKMGSCIEQTYLMKYLLDRLDIPCRMFCIREYEADNNVTRFNVYMHCFILYSLNGKVYHIENCNLTKLGIYEYSSYEEAINSISKFFIMVSDGRWSMVTEFFDVPYGMSFKELNRYMNDLDLDKEDTNNLDIDKSNVRVRKKIV